jgi:hypothetical protein
VKNKCKIKKEKSRSIGGGRKQKRKGVGRRKERERNICDVNHPYFKHHDKSVSQLQTHDSCERDATVLATGPSQFLLSLKP